MTYNAEVFHRTASEVNTQIASYFDIVDNSVQMADTNKRYTINPQSCYAHLLTASSPLRTMGAALLTMSLAPVRSFLKNVPNAMPRDVSIPLN